MDEDRLLTDPDKLYSKIKEHEDKGTIQEVYDAILDDFEGKMSYGDKFKDRSEAQEGVKSMLNTFMNTHEDKKKNDEKRGNKLEAVRNLLAAQLDPEKKEEKKVSHKDYEKAMEQYLFNRNSAKKKLIEMYFDNNEDMSEETMKSLLQLWPDLKDRDQVVRDAMNDITRTKNWGDTTFNSMPMDGNEQAPNTSEEGFGPEKE